MPTEVSFLEIVDTPSMRASRRSDGLLQLTIRPGTYATLAMVKEAIEALGKAGGGECCPLLIVAGKDTTVTTEAMEYMSKQESDPYSKAEAYLISSISQKLLGNFYLSFNKPKKPTRIFTKQSDAEEWLYSFR
jgi:hypothetical protein